MNQLPTVKLTHETQKKQLFITVCCTKMSRVFLNKIPRYIKDVRNTWIILKNNFNFLLTTHSIPVNKFLEYNTANSRNEILNIINH